MNNDFDIRDGILYKYTGIQEMNSLWSFPILSVGFMKKRFAVAPLW